MKKKWYKNVDFYSCNFLHIYHVSLLDDIQNTLGIQLFLEAFSATEIEKLRQNRQNRWLRRPQKVVLFKESGDLLSDSGYALFVAQKAPFSQMVTRFSNDFWINFISKHTAIRCYT